MKLTKKRISSIGLILAISCFMILAIASVEDPTMVGTWTRTSSTGELPASTPTVIIFEGEGGAGTGHFIDNFWNTRQDFNWSLSDETFYMSKIPGGEGIVGMTGNTIATADAYNDELVFIYPNGSSATFIRN